MATREIKRTALVTFTPEQMFDLVVDVERYREFLPWVAGAEVHEKTERDLQASLIMERAGIRQSFTTRNVMQRPDWMSLELVNGPFKRLDGLWTFTAIGTAGTQDRAGHEVRVREPRGVDAVRPGVRAECRRADRCVRGARQASPRRGIVAVGEGTAHVEVVYALPDRQRVVTLALPEAGLTAQAAVERSGLLDEFPEPARPAARPRNLRDGLRAGPSTARSAIGSKSIDRSQVDPRAQRRERAAHAARTGSQTLNERRGAAGRQRRGSVGRCRPARVRAGLLRPQQPVAAPGRRRRPESGLSAAGVFCGCSLPCGSTGRPGFSTRLTLSPSKCTM